MAAIGGDTVVPTNWPGLIAVSIIIAIIAVVTYFGIDMTQGSVEEGPEASEKALSVQEVFSASARREVAMAEPVRALSRTDFSGSTEMQGSADDDWDSPAQDSDMDTSVNGDMQDWDSAETDADASSDIDWGADAESASSGMDSVDTGSLADDVKATLAELDDKPADTTMETAAATAAQRASAARPAPAKAMAKEPEPKVTDTRARLSTEALDAWWRKAEGNLKVRFAGTLDRGAEVSDGIAVMFSEAVAPAGASQHLKLADSSGKTIDGVWKAGANPNLILLEGLEQGRYTLTINSGLTGTHGSRLDSTVSGPVFVY